MKKGFTIVELLMVVGIMAILLGIVTTAASESIKAARQRKADAVCTVVQAAFAAFYAQNDRWPGGVGSRIESGSLGTRSNQEGPGYSNDPEKFVLTRSEIDECIREMVLETKKGNPVMDVSGLYVSRHEGRYGEDCFGIDFMQAATIKGMSEAKSRLSRATGGTRLTVNNMHFGYPDPSTGRFRHFKVVYSIPTDSFSVSQMDSDERRARANDQ